MIRTIHLLDDFAMGGVTRALTMFTQPAIASIASAQIMPMGRDPRDAAPLRADVIICHVPPCWSRLPYLAMLRLHNPKARMIHVEHSYTKAFEEHRVSAPRRFRLLLKLAARCFDEIVCVSKAQRNWMVGTVGIPAAKVQVIYPWSGRDELMDIAPARPRKDAPLRLLAYGRFSHEKNFANLIHAMAKFSPARAQLTLFGRGPEQPGLAAAATGLPHVTLHGATDDPGEYLARCDAVIVPSLHEAFGLVATEARMAGRAIIVADVDGLPEQAAKGGIVAPMHSADDIAAAIARALQAPIANMGAQARDHVQEQHRRILDGWRVVLTRKAHVRSTMPAMTGYFSTDSMA
ncbi:MAG: glycosyltransferase [Novosphingopyxis baekryungensis]|nr:glycosyltransferase [Novosphingopyxis baekryungensis]